MLFVSSPSGNFSRSSVSTCAVVFIFIFIFLTPRVQPANTLRVKWCKNVRGSEIFPWFWSVWCRHHLNIGTLDWKRSLGSQLPCFRLSQAPPYYPFYKRIQLRLSRACFLSSFGKPFPNVAILSRSPGSWASWNCPSYSWPVQRGDRQPGRFALTENYAPGAEPKGKNKIGLPRLDKKCC